MDELNISVINWLNLTANQRIHATTKQKPLERWVIEKPYLTNLVHNYTTNYGTKGLSITTSNLIMKHNEIPLQHNLSIYDSLFLNMGV